MVTVENGSLMIAATGGTSSVGDRTARRTSSSRGAGRVELRAGDDGKATQLIFRQPGGQMVAKKVQ
ncbi:MAG: hypothetical protein IPK33_13605 [Gemmatimonadetes bacterium]|nr:hypothetical protein [Gemmatimonadota bacterium]